MCNFMGRDFSIFLGKHLNDACKLSEFAMQGFQTICMFFRCFQIFFSFLSVKYFNKPKPCRIFFRCLNCAPHPFCVILSFFSHSIFWCFFFFVHLMPVYSFSCINLWADFPPQPQIVFSFTACVVGIYKNLDIKSIDLKTCFIGSQF